MGEWFANTRSNWDNSRSTATTTAGMGGIELQKGECPFDEPDIAVAIELFDPEAPQLWLGAIIVVVPSQK